MIRFFKKKAHLEFFKNITVKLFLLWVEIHQSLYDLKRERDWQQFMYPAHLNLRVYLGMIMQFVMLQFQKSIFFNPAFPTTDDM